MGFARICFRYLRDTHLQGFCRRLFQTPAWHNFTMVLQGSVSDTPAYTWHTPQWFCRGLFQTPALHTSTPFLIMWTNTSWSFSPQFQEVYNLLVFFSWVIVQELCESRGGRPGLSVLSSLLASVDVKNYWTMLQHWSQLVPNMSTDIWGH